MFSTHHGLEIDHRLLVVLREDLHHISHEVVVVVHRVRDAVEIQEVATRGGDLKVTEGRQAGHGVNGGGGVMVQGAPVNVWHVERDGALPGVSL